MKIGLQTSTFDKQSYGRWGENTYKKMKEHGYSCSDFCMVESDFPIFTLPTEEGDALLLKEKELAAQAGIEIFQVHGPWRWPPQDNTEEDRAERMEKMKKSIRGTAIIGCKNWVIHPIMPYGIEEINIPEAQKTWDLNMEFMGELLKTAKEYDVTICLENMPMPEFSLGTPEAVLKFVNEMNDEHFKICLDTGHVSVYNNLSLKKEVKRLGKEIRALHIHDNKCGNDLHLMPYYGVINWQEFADTLKEIDFDGCFSLETVLPHNLSDDIFEQSAKLLVNIAKDIIKKAGL